MSTTSTILGETHCGGKRQSWGTYSTDSTDTTGTVTTGLNVVEGFTIVASGDTVTALQCVCYETFPLNTDGVTVSFTASSDGYWTAIGT